MGLGDIIAAHGPEAHGRGRAAIIAAAAAGPEGRGRGRAARRAGAGAARQARGRGRGGRRARARGGVPRAEKGRGAFRRRARLELDPEAILHENDKVKYDKEEPDHPAGNVSWWTEPEKIALFMGLNANRKWIKGNFDTPDGGVSLRDKCWQEVVGKSLLCKIVKI